MIRTIWVGVIVGFLWAIAPSLTHEWVYEDYATMAQVLPLWMPRGLSAWTWQVVNTPLASHLFNLTLHVLCTFLLVRILPIVIGSSLVAQIAGMIWLTLPLHTQALGYASARADLLMAVFVLAGVWVALTRTGGLLALVACVVCSVWAKEFGAVLLVLIPLTLAAYPSQWTHAQRWHIAYGILLAIFLGVLAYQGDIQTIGRTATIGTMPMADWAALQATAAMRLVSMMAFSIIGPLTVDFDYDAVPGLVRLVSLGLLVTCSALAWHLRHLRRAVSYGLAFFVLAVLPRLFVQTPKSYLNESQFYVPAIGPIIVVASLLSLYERHRQTDHHARVQ